MKLWEILPQLKEGQTINITYKNGTRDTFTCDDGTIRRVDNGFIMTLHREHLEADYEIIPQSVPFVEALKALREGKTICCEYDKKLKYNPHWSGEVVGVTIAPDSPNYMLDMDMILNGKWWVK